MKMYIGIDPGTEGFISIIGDEGVTEFISIEDSHPLDVAAFFENISQGENHAILEDVHALFGVSAKSTFNFGFCKGWLMGLLIAYKIPYTLVAPKDWQAEVWTKADKVMDGRKVNTKATSINCARRLFPDVDFRRNSRCKVRDHNKCDAILMAEYARRKNL